MNKTFLVLCSLIFLSSSSIYAQELSKKEVSHIQAKIKKLDAMEQEAFKQGDCEKVISYFDKNITFYANGRKAPSLEFILNFCKQIPRPFGQTGMISDSIHVLSEKVAYTIRQIEFEPEKGADNKETFQNTGTKTKKDRRSTHLVF
ncbi:MAG: hypothetical protein U5J95_04745 [Balneolaceae bacterium]|nr:hypothetical protein [Balneolaceae bacterium]